MMAAFMTSCGGGSAWYSTVTAQGFVNALNSLDYGYYYEYTIMKDPTYQYGHIVMYDPYTETYRAVDIGAFRAVYRDSVDAAYAYLSGNVSWLSEDVHYLGWDEYQGDITGLIYENTGEAQKDLVFFAKAQEEAKKIAHGKAIAEAYGLSETQGVRVATLAANWEKLAATREVTVADADAFSQQLFGFSMAQIAEAGARSTLGDNSKADELIAQAASAVETTPENIRALLAAAQSN